MQTKLASACAAILWLSAAMSAQSPAGSTATHAQTSGEHVTVKGCVEAGPNNTYTLTGAAPANEPPLGTTATTPAGDKVAKTITYTLSGAKNDELKAHVGHTVEVTGTESAPQAQTKVDEKSPLTAATGTTGSSAGSAKPKVETTAQAQIVARQLTVSSVKMVSSSCTLLK